MTPTNKSSLHPILLIAGIAVILFCAIGAAAIMGWLPSSIGRNTDSGQLSTADRNLSDSSASNTSNTKSPVAPAHDVMPAQRAPVHAGNAIPHVVASATPHKAVCSECGVIESIRDIDTRSDSNGVGAAGGAVVGGLLGNQVGGGHGKEAMTVAGVIGGALVGNQIERRSRTTRSYEVVVHLNDGSTRSIHEADVSGWHTGDPVRFINGELHSN